MSKTYTAAEVREIVGLIILSQTGLLPPSEEIATEGAKALFSDDNLGNLRHWAAFSEVFAFAYDPDTLDVHAVARSGDFLGDPIADLLAELKEKHDGGTVEVWGIRHVWGPSVAGPGKPECLHSEGRRPKDEADLWQVVAVARHFETPVGHAPR
jgi:hypothetical protein